MLSRVLLAGLAGAGLAVGLWLRRARLEPVRVAGSSMAPTLTEGALLAVGPVTRAPRRGQLVLVRRPEAGDMELVKRIVGLPGERVRLAGPRLEVDGRPLPEPYLPPGPRAAAGPAPLQVRLGPDEYLVLGDRRDASTDGRSFGPIGRHDVIGIVRFVYWPPSVWRTGRVIKRLGISTVLRRAKGDRAAGIERGQPK
jgi:signal peptidase I